MTEIKNGKRVTKLLSKNHQYDYLKYLAILIIILTVELNYFLRKVTTVTFT